MRALSDPNAAAYHGDWSVFVADKPKECWAASAPSERFIIPPTQRNVRKLSRGEILLMAVARPGASNEKFVTFTPGYKLDPKTRVWLQVGTQSYDFSHKGLFAWAAGGSIADTEIIKAMAAGTTATMNVSASASSREVFSLRGFTAAWADTKKRCNIR